MRVGINTGNGLSVTNAGELVSTNPISTDSALFSFEGTIVPQTGLARYYPIQTCQVNSFYASLNTVSTSITTLALYKNGVEIPNTTAVIAAGEYKSATIYSTESLEPTDYLTCDIVTGAGGEDCFVNVLLQYTVDGITHEVAKDIASRTKIGQVKVGEGLLVDKFGTIQVDPLSLPAPILPSPNIFVRDNYDISFYIPGTIPPSSVIHRTIAANTFSLTSKIFGKVSTPELAYEFLPLSTFNILKNGEIIGEFSFVVQPIDGGYPYTSPDTLPEDTPGTFKGSILETIFNAGDILEVVSPPAETAVNPQPGTMTGLSICIGGVGLTTDLVLPGPKGDTGATGIGVPGKSAYEIAVAQGFSGSEADWLNSLIGPQGANGEFGGPEGPQGPQGEQGPQGKSAYEVAVDHGYSGDTWEWLNSLVGPQGTSGDNGPQGEEGRSAYQVAVDNGYTGTESEWVASMSGGGGGESFNPYTMANITSISQIEEFSLEGYSVYLPGARIPFEINKPLVKNGLTCVVASDNAYLLNTICIESSLPITEPITIKITLVSNGREASVDSNTLEELGIFTEVTAELIGPISIPAISMTPDPQTSYATYIDSASDGTIVLAGSLFTEKVQGLSQLGYSTRLYLNNKKNFGNPQGVPLATFEGFDYSAYIANTNSDQSMPLDSLRYLWWGEALVFEVSTTNTETKLNLVVSAEVVA